jgi:hypothetical protein
MDGVGVNTHGLVLWHSVFVCLSSKETALIMLDPQKREVRTVWQVGLLHWLIVHLPNISST